MEYQYNKYKEELTYGKKLKRKLKLLEKEYEDGQNELYGSEKKYVKPSMDKINTVVDCINQRFMTRTEGTEMLEIPYSTMCDHVSKNGVKPRPRNKPTNLKILDEHKVELKDYIEKVPNATQPMMCEHLKCKYGINTSQSSISRILKSMKT
jgi:hypothetical protein